jgi:hypothetical protein
MNRLRHAHRASNFVQPSDPRLLSWTPADGWHYADSPFPPNTKLPFALVFESRSNQSIGVYAAHTSTVTGTIVYENPSRLLRLERDGTVLWAFMSASDLDAFVKSKSGLAGAFEYEALCERAVEDVISEMVESGELIQTDDGHLTLATGATTK